MDRIYLCHSGNICRHISFFHKTSTNPSPFSEVETSLPPQHFLLTPGLYPSCFLQLFSPTHLRPLMLFQASAETKKTGIKYKLQVIPHCSFFTFCFGSSMTLLSSSWQFTILQVCQINQGPRLISCF